MISKNNFLLALLLLITWSISPAWAQDWRYLQLFAEEWSAEEENILEEGGAEEANISDPPFIQFFCEERSQFCPEIYRPVCATDCLEGNCEGTYSNACNACGNPNVQGYTPGTCDAQRTVCVQPDLSATDIACTDIYDPVCAYWSDCNQEPCGKTVGNACQACLQQGASYHTPGECI